MSVALNNHLSLKYLRSWMKSEVYLLDKKFHAIIKKKKKKKKNSGTLTSL